MNNVFNNLFHIHTHCICIAFQVLNPYSNVQICCDAILSCFAHSLQTCKQTHTCTHSVHTPIQKLQGIILISVDRISSIETVYVLRLLFTSLLLEMRHVRALA